MITHQDGAYKEQTYDTCVMLHLTEVTDDLATTEHFRPRDNNHNNRGYHQHEQPPRYIRLTWDERGANVEYLLRFNDTKSGTWQSAAPQQGTMTERYYNKPFSGTVQVLKAVGNHLVLTFCEAAPNHQMFTIILSRQRNSLTYSEIKSIKGLLDYRRLPLSSVRKVCLNGAASLYNSKTGILLFVVSLVCVMRSLVGSNSKQQ